MNITIITGATGKIASAYINAVLATGKKDEYIIGLTRKETNKVADNIKLVNTDYSFESLGKIFAEIATIPNVEITIIHTACAVPPTTLMARNSSIAIFDSLLRVAAFYKITNIVLLSSMAVYPKRSIDAREDEMFMHKALNPYGEMKRKIELLALEYSDIITTKILRLGTVVTGEGSNIIDTYKSCIKLDKPLVLYNYAKYGYQTYIDMQDVLIAINKAKYYGKTDIFNIGSPDILQNDKIAEIMSKKANSRIIEAICNYKEITMIKLNTEKAEKLLGFRAKSVLDLL